MMKWKKLGQVYQVKNDHPLLLSHAANPLAVLLQDDVYRVFYSGRDHMNRSSVSYVDIDIVRRQIIYDHKAPVFTYGDERSFYSHGVSIGNLYTIGQADYILFMGWKTEAGEHWKGYIGRSRVMDKETWVPDPGTPFLSPDAEDPVSLSYPWVVFHNGIYKMWYGSTVTWDAGNNEMLHVIKYATSENGSEWKKHGVAIPYGLGIAQAFSRPSVVIDDEGYHMWYSFRSGDGSKYRIGYAHSGDGIQWERQAGPAIDISAGGWDSEMTCYPFVFDHKGERYMLYNGNAHGKSGFGLAITFH